MKSLTCLCIAVLVALTAACSHTTGMISPPTLQRLDYTSALDQSERQFFVYLPTGYYSDPDRQWPVLMFLHGNGERGNGRDELGYVLNHGPLYEAWIQKKDLPFIMIVPQLPMFGMDEHADYLRDRKLSDIPQRMPGGVPARPARFATPQPMDGVAAPESMADVPITLPNGWDRIETDLISMLARVEREYQVDSRRLYLTGLSYGGFGTWYIASKHPERFAAIAPVVGWGHPDLMAPIAEARLPLWAFAAGRDPVVSIEHFYPGLNELETLGHPAVRFTNHEDMGHDAWVRVYQSDDLYQWLLEQKRPER